MAFLYTHTRTTKPYPMCKEFTRSSTESGTGQDGDASLFPEGLCTLDVCRYMTGLCQTK
jgi:hypothetical protein